MEQLEYLKEKVFVGLGNLNDGFDAKSIYYFSESDFQKVLDRVEELGIGNRGIEPWLNGEFYDVAVCEDFGMVPSDPRWYRKAFQAFKQSGKALRYASSFEIPIGLLGR